MKYLHTFNGQYVISSHKYLEGCVPQDVSTLYQQRVPLHAPWLIDNSNSFLRKILIRTPKTTLIDNVIHLYVFSNDPIVKQVNVPSDMIIMKDIKTVCPPHLEEHKKKNVDKEIERLMKPISNYKCKLFE